MLHKAIDSVIKQTYPHWELIIIDNHSDDATDDLIRSYQNPKIKLYKIHNQGIVARSRNIGIQKAQGELISFLDSDDWWKPRKLEFSKNYIQEYGADFVYHDLYQINSGIKKFIFKIRRKKNLLSPVFRDLTQNRNVISNSSVVVKKKLLEKVGLISEDKEKVTWEDYDTWVKIAKLTNAFKRIPKTLGYYWTGTEALSSYEQTIKNIINIKRCFKESYGIYDNTPWWMDYCMGSSYYHIKEYKLALKYFRKTEHLPVSFALKKHVFLIASLFRRVSKN